MSNTNLNTLDASQGIVFTNAATNSECGFAVFNAGDVNNDGYDDVVMGAPQSNIAYVVYGSASMGTTTSIDLSNMSASQGYTITSSVMPTDAKFGASVAGAGDVNGDGFDDVIIGTAKYGRCVVYGGASLKSTIDCTGAINVSEGFIITDAAGPVGGGGDVNNDGFDDVIMGYPSNNTAHVVYGGPALKTVSLSSMSAADGFTIIPGSGVDQAVEFGAAVANAGDVNGDGFADVIIGSAGFGGVVIFGGASLGSQVNCAYLTIESGLTISGDAGSVGSAGDMNNDGFDDVIMGSPFSNTAYVIYGGVPSDSTLILDTLTKSQGLIVMSSISPFYVKFGVSVSGAGDVNNDGFDDVIMGTAGYGACVVYGGGSLGASVDCVSPEDMNSNAGYVITGSAGTVSGGGDVNKDGFADVVLGSPFANSDNGQVYVLYGAVSPSSYESNSNVMSNAAIAGVSVASVVVVAIVIYGVFAYVKTMWPFRRNPLLKNNIGSNA